MSLDIGIGHGTSPMPVPSEPFLCLNSDGYYWFLYPLIERLQAESGQYIDLYGAASFSGEGLAALERMLVDARKLVETKPDTWRVHTGTQTHPEHKELYDDVEKASFLALLSKWEQIIERAKRLGKSVVCFGD